MKNFRNLCKLLTLSGLLAMSIQAVQARPEEGPATAGNDRPSHYTNTAEDKVSSSDQDNNRELATAKAKHERNMKRLKDLAAKGKAPRDPDVSDVDEEGSGSGSRNIAVVVDNGTIVLPEAPAKPLDIQPGTQIRFAPTGAHTFNVDLLSGVALDPSFGTPITFIDGSGPPDDAFYEAAIPFTFTFMGIGYHSIFVGSDGHITFGAGDGTSTNRDIGRAAGGPPRLSVLLADYDVGCGGTDYVDVRADRVVVTWNNIVHFQRELIDGCGIGVSGNTMQAILYNNGTIEYRYGTLDFPIFNDPTLNTGNNGSVIGIAEGNSTGPYTELDLTTELPKTNLQAGAIYEEFTPVIRYISVDDIQLSKVFYSTHHDYYDLLVHFEDFPNASGGSAHELSTKNQTLGLNRGIQDDDAIFGSAGELEAVLYMNDIYKWYGQKANDFINPPIIPFDVYSNPPSLLGSLGVSLPLPWAAGTSPFEFFGYRDITQNGDKNRQDRLVSLSNPSNDPRFAVDTVIYNTNSLISIIGQESGHRWLAAPLILHPTDPTTRANRRSLLGRADIHWSTFFNTRTDYEGADGYSRFSNAEGNALIEVQNTGKKIVDKENPSRVLKDKNGEIKTVISACAAQGKSAFISEPKMLTDGWTELDQYLMGVRTAAEVKPFWFVDQPTSPIDGRALNDFPMDFLRGSTFQESNLAFCGKRVTLTVMDNIWPLGGLLADPTLGPRYPIIGDENDLAADSSDVSKCNAAGNGCADVKTMAFILLTQSTTPSKNRLDAVRKVNEVRKAWEAYTAKALDYRNADGVVRMPTLKNGKPNPAYIPKFDTRLNPPIH
jgi:hypothetical protein